MKKRVQLYELQDWKQHYEVRKKHKISQLFALDLPRNTK